MASTPVTTPPSDSAPPPSPPDSSTSPPPDSSTPAPPPPDISSSPPPDSTPPPPQASSSPPPSSTPPTPPSAPPPGGDNFFPPPQPDSGGSGSPSSSPPPPPSDAATPSSPPPPSSPSTPSASVVPPPPPPKTPSDSSSQLFPPPPHSSSSRSHSNGSSPSSSHQSSNNINLPLIVGVSAGIGLFFILMIVAVICCSRKKKRPDDHVNYYVDPSRKPPKGVGYYGSSPQPSNWSPPQPMMDHMMGGRIPPPPGAAAWQYPPPPPPVLHSSDMSSSNFSGGPRGPPLPPPSPNVALGFSKSTFSYEDLAAATDGFSQANLLGQGGFGYVYKGMLPNGKEIAVKQLKSGSGQGEKEFQAEVEIISRVHHRHLVSLVGYCIAGGQRMLVYEFVPNNTLEFHLHGKGRPTMDFPTRLKIALGSAKGLAYLHEDCHPRIIHRDIKAANILLDYNFEAMVADFGLAKPSSDANTHVSTRVMGTFGYLAPEYASSGKLTEKSDVFSYGVMLLELITGRRPVDTSNLSMEDSMVEWARPLMAKALENGNYEELVDSRLENNYNSSQMMRMVASAAACVRHSAKRRPKMSQIVRALEGDVSLDDLNEGVKPGQSSMFSSTGSSDYDSSSYNADMKRMRRMALGSQDFASSEYSGRTSEYGQHPSSSSSDAGNTREFNQKNFP